MGTPSVCLELHNHQNRKENTMAQVILNLEIDEILRAFTTGAKNEGFRLLLQKGYRGWSIKTKINEAINYF